MEIIGYVLVLLISLRSCSGSFEYIPPSLEINVTENGEYSVGIKEIENATITRCDYESDTGIKGSFEVGKYKKFDYPKNIRSYNSWKNNFTHNGNAGHCEIKVKNADGSGPTKWNLTAFGGSSNQALTAVAFKVNFFYKPPLLWENIYLLESEGFFQYLNISSDVTLKSCKLNWTENFKNIEVDLLVQKNDESKRLSTFGRGLCGFKVMEAIKEDNHKWTLTATDNQNKFYRATFTSVILEKPNRDALNIKEHVYIGSWKMLRCGEKTMQEFCILYNPMGEFVYTKENDCSYTIDTVSLKDIGVWKCVTGSKRTLIPVNYTVELVNQEHKSIETWVDEKESYLSLGCRMRNSDWRGITLCKIVAPNQQIFTPYSGFASKRHLAYGTDFANEICVLEIQKPLLPFEIGTWRCELSTSIRQAGAFINVGQAKTLTYPKTLHINTQLDKPFTIICQVPYSSPYCHITSPNGTIYTQEGDEATFGKCTLRVEKTEAAHDGTWVCSFPREIGVPDETILIEVTIPEVLIIYNDVRTDSGKEVELMCTSRGLPLQYCRFVSPSGEAYHIPNHHKSSTISYSGLGLEYGDCGITIANPQRSHAGNWTCVTRIGARFAQKEISARIFLEIPEEFFSASTIGMGIGIAAAVVVATTIIAYVAVRKWKQRHPSEITGSSFQRQRRRDEEEDENIDIFSLGPIPRSYTNTAHEDDRHVHQL